MGGNKVKKFKSLLFCVSLILTLLISCSSQQGRINLHSLHHEFKYTLPYESGYYYEDNGKFKILLKFYRPNQLFKKDTNELLHILICCDRSYIESSKYSGEIIAFFNRVQMRPNYGLMEITEIETYHSSKGRLSINGELISDTSHDSDQDPIKLEVKFKDLPLEKVDSVYELHKHTTEYFRYMRGRGVYPNTCSLIFQVDFPFLKASS